MYADPSKQREIRVEQLYSQVEKIEIHHVRVHTSFVCRSQQEGTWVVTPQSEVCFVLSCFNRECTSSVSTSVVSSALQYIASTFVLLTYLI